MAAVTLPSSEQIDEAVGSISSKMAALDWVQIAQEKLRQLHLPVIALGVGSPSKKIPFKVRFKAAMKDIQTPPGYKPLQGDAETLQCVSEFVNHYTNLPDHFTAANVAITSGSSYAYSILSKYFKENNMGMLLVEPYYPYHDEQIKHEHGSVGYIPTSVESRNIPTEAQIRSAMKKNKNAKAITLVFPNNPQGTVLHDEDAKALATALNNIVKTNPDFHIVLDDAYVPIIDPKIGTNSIYTHLSPEAQQNCFLLVSSSKMISMAHKRVGAIVTKKPDFVSSIAVNTLGVQTMAVPPAMAQAWRSGLQMYLENPAKTQQQLWDYYGGRIKIMADGLQDIEKKLLGEKYDETKSRFVRNRPEGGMFLVAHLDMLKGCKVPPECMSIVGSNIIKTDDHIAKMLLAMSKLGYAPVGVAAGQAFGFKPEECAIRISCVAKNPELLKESLNTIAGMMQVLGVNPEVDLKAAPNMTRVHNIITRDGEALKDKAWHGIQDGTHAVTDFGKRIAHGGVNSARNLKDRIHFERSKQPVPGLAS